MLTVVAAGVGEMRVARKCASIVRIVRMGAHLQRVATHAHDRIERREVEMAPVVEPRLLGWQTEGNRGGVRLMKQALGEYGTRPKKNTKTKPALHKKTET